MTSLVTVADEESWMGPKEWEELKRVLDSVHFNITTFDLGLMMQEEWEEERKAAKAKETK